MTEPNSQPKPTGEELAAKTAAGMALNASELLGSRPGADKAGIVDKASIDKAGKAAAKSACARPQIDSVRETVESIAVAFILAFLFRTFVAEAFVIPTGSMATTLMGRHKDMVCPNCKYQFHGGASAECDRATGEVIPGVHVEKALCPNCGMPVDTRNTTDYPSYKGDRIIVSKLASDEPTRWNVTVFRYPEEAGTNYIKRLVGLPGEVIKIQNGDLSSRPIDEPGKPFRILRKPPEVVLSMLRDVYDNDHIAQWMTEAGWPPRWQPCPTDIVSLTKSGWGKGNQAPWPWPAQGPPKAGQWTSDDYRSFGTDGSAEGEVWIRYQHFRPDETTWQELIRRAPPEVVQGYYLPESRPELREQRREALLKPKTPESLPALRPEFYPITDLTGYNDTSLGGLEPRGERDVWVGDLAVGCEVAAAEPRGEVVLELIEAGHRFRCHLNLAERSIRLTADESALRFEGEEGRAATEPGAKNAIPAGKAFQVLFANVDSQLLVWVDGKLVSFDGPTTYPLTVTQADSTVADNSPVGVASKGVNVRVNHLRVLRDVYYRSHDEERGDDYPLIKDAKNPDNDQFFMLGDNSPQSLDARAWSRKYVERKLLIGKALYIFWPHSWDSPLPFTPNWKRMQFIR